MLVIYKSTEWTIIILYLIVKNSIQELLGWET